MLSVLERTRRFNEARIVQPYVRRVWSAPLVHPAVPSCVQERAVHARYSLFTSNAGAAPVLAGGVATFSTSWKAAGQRASYDGQGRVCGSAFADVRIAAGPA